MKGFFYSLLSATLVLFMTSCANSIFDDLDLDLEAGELQDFSMIKEDGSNIKFEEIVYDPCLESSPGNCFVNAHEDLKSWNVAYLSITFKSDLLPGQEIIPEKIRFGHYFSSDYWNHVFNYTGKMTLKAKSDKCVVISMENVKFSLKDGDYVLNGDLVAKVE